MKIGLRNVLPLQLLAAALAASVIGCSSADSATSSGATEALATNGMSPAATTAWKSYVSEATVPALQTGCTPYALAPEAGTPYRGTALLLHGFSACPQQYAQIAKNLSGAGYAVLVPLLPGHGHAYKTDSSGAATDDTSALPTDSSYEEYGTFAKQMAGIVAQAGPGENVVMGLSVGGALAASVAEQSPGTFKRVLLMNAFFDIASGFAAALAPVFSAIAPEFPFGWGAGCEQERTSGRAGFCQFEITNLRAVQHFGQDTLAKIGTIQDEVQVVGVEDDPAASDDAEVTAATGISGAKACFFEKGVPHSAFSPQDNPGVDMYWLTDLLEGTQGFLAYDDTFKTAEASTITPYARCEAH